MSDDSTVDHRGADASGVAAQVEAHIAERIRVGKQPSKSEMEWMRSWPALIASGEPHPWYGPCDGLEPDGECSECTKLSGKKKGAGADAAPATQAICEICGCTTGGGRHCYEHAPYTVSPQKDGTFLVDRNGQRSRVSYEPPATPPASSGVSHQENEKEDQSRMESRTQTDQQSELPRQATGPSGSRFRKKPVVIEAFPIPVPGENTYVPIPTWLVEAISKKTVEMIPTGGAIIHTLEGDMRGDVGDWIIQGVKGELYPCKPDIFTATYEPASGVSEATRREFDVELELRRELWAGHGCHFPALYGDDGEMQCQHLIDFKRMPIAELVGRVHAMRMKRVADAINKGIEGFPAPPAVKGDE